jgi:glycosyltransferase involved in cell wall biosynthesis
MLVWYWGRRGGGPRYTLELLRALAERPDIELAASLSSGNEVLSELPALRGPQQIVDTYSDVRSFVGASLRLPAIRRDFSRFIRSARPDVVVSVMPHPWSWYLAQAVPASGSRLVSIIHDAYMHPGEINPLWSWRIGRELAAADRVVALSRHVQQQLVTGYRYPADRIAVIPLGPFAYADETEAPRLFPRGRPFRFLFFGRVLAYKGIRVLLDAFRALAGERNDVELCIAGGGDLAPYRALLADLPRVTVINRWIEECEIPRLLSEADALVAAYTEASQSAAVATAYGSGMPVVVTPVGGLVEQVVPGETGLVAAETSGAAVARAMSALLEPRLYERCAAGARQAASDGAGWRRTAETLVEHCAVAGGVLAPAAAAS